MKKTPLTAAPSKTLQALVITVLEDMKAENITLLDVRHRATFTDTMILASGKSTRHVSAIAETLIETMKATGTPAIGAEGVAVGEWALIDLGDVVAHIMLPATREFYDLETLWTEIAIDPGTDAHAQEAQPD